MYIALIMIYIDECHEMDRVVVPCREHQWICIYPILSDSLHLIKTTHTVRIVCKVFP